MTAFVESCVQTAAGSAAAAEKHAHTRNRAKQLIKKLAGKKRILVTTHQHPDPDALASSIGMASLLRQKLKKTRVDISIKGKIGGGINDAFNRIIHLNPLKWSDSMLRRYDAVILVDTQPTFGYSPLPIGVLPFAVIDHHRARGRRPKVSFSDIRTDVGATSSIIFSYFMDLELPIDAELSATLLFGVETDLAGTAGTPGELDNMALSSLVLTADTHKLYQMRYVDLPQSYYIAYHQALTTASIYDNLVIAHLETIESPEQPAIIADFLLRFDKAQAAFVTAIHNGRLVMSLRTSWKDRSAGDIMRRLLRNLGEGGGHRTKAGGFTPLENGSDTEIDRVRKTLRKRLLRILKIHVPRGERLVPRVDTAD